MYGEQFGEFVCQHWSLKCEITALHNTEDAFN